LREAEELGVQAMEARLRVLGQEHPDTFTIMADCAMTFWLQGDIAEALCMLKRYLTRYKSRSSESIIMARRHLVQF
jgi:hypothetical protein